MKSKRVAQDERSMLTVAEIATRWGVNVKTVYEEIRLGHLSCVRLGKRKIIRVPRVAVESYEEQGRVVPSGGPHGGSTG